MRDFRNGDNLMLGGLEFMILEDKTGVCLLNSICSTGCCNVCKYDSIFGENNCTKKFESTKALTEWVKEQKLKKRTPFFTHAKILNI